MFILLIRGETCLKPEIKDSAVLSNEVCSAATAGIAQSVGMTDKNSDVGAGLAELPRVAEMEKLASRNFREQQK